MWASTTASARGHSPRPGSDPLVFFLRKPGRWRESAGDVLQQLGEANRRAVLEERSHDLNADGESARRPADRRDSRGQAGERCRYLPVDELEVRAATLGCRNRARVVERRAGVVVRV